jgi:hypothetical protein
MSRELVISAVTIHRRTRSPRKRAYSRQDYAAFAIADASARCWSTPFLSGNATAAIAAGDLSFTAILA